MVSSELSIPWIEAVFLVVAIVVYVTTHNPLLFAAVSAVYTGKNALMSGRWVFHHDPLRLRATICCAFHVSTAIWQGAPAALLTLVIFGIIEQQLGRPINVEHVQATLIAMLLAIALSSVIGLVAALAAAIAGVKVWAHPRFESALYQELTQAQPRLPPFNFGVFVLATSIGLPIMTLGCLFMVNPVGPWVLPVVLLGGPVVAIITYGWLAARIFARGPRDYLAAGSTL